MYMVKIASDCIHDAAKADSFGSHQFVDCLLNLWSNLRLAMFCRSNEMVEELPVGHGLDSWSRRAPFTGRRFLAQSFSSGTMDVKANRRKQQTRFLGHARPALKTPGYVTTPGQPGSVGPHQPNQPRSRGVVPSPELKLRGDDANRQNHFNFFNTLSSSRWLRPARSKSEAETPPASGERQWAMRVCKWRR